MFSNGLILWRKLEGGFVVDQGGITVCGIRKDLYLEARPGAKWPPSEQEHAEYLREFYWDKHHCGDLPEPADSVFFQWLGNAVVAAIQGLQIVVGASPDGDLGPKTIMAIKGRQSDDLTRGLLIAQQMFYVVQHPFGTMDFQGLQNRVERVEASLAAGELRS
jgi:lysozyme family protein